MSRSQGKYCIVGAGPAGLAMAAALRRRQVAFDHLERHTGVGGIWDIDNPGSPLYESAHFISSKTLSGFPGYPMPEGYPDYPRWDQIRDYIRAFARDHGLLEGIRFGVEVERVEPRSGDASVWVAGKEHTYAGVICASGVNWHPNQPGISGHFAGERRHAVTYRAPKELEGKSVLVVGLGNSGADIACDAVRSAREVFVSVRRGYHFIPKHIFGQPADVFANSGPVLPVRLETWLFGWLQRLLVGDTTRLGMPKPDHAVLESHPLMNDQLLHHLRHGDVRLVPDVTRFDERRVYLADGQHIEVDVVLFATGYTRQIAYLAPVYLDGNSWAAGHYLTCFSRRYPSLFTLGFAELNGALYPHLGRLAALIAEVAHARLEDPAVAERFFEWAGKQRRDLSGARRRIPSTRHQHYCDDHVLAAETRKAFRHMGWRPPDARN